MPRDGTANLKPVKSKEEAKERGKLGGIASGKARREKKQMQELMKAYLDLPLNDGDTEDIDGIKSVSGIKGKNIDQRLRNILNLQKVADRCNGSSVEAIRLMLDIAGEIPDKTVNIGTDAEDMNLNINVSYGKEDAVNEEKES